MKEQKIPPYLGGFVDLFKNQKITEMREPNWFSMNSSTLRVVMLSTRGRTFESQVLRDRNSVLRTLKAILTKLFSLVNDFNKRKRAEFSRF